MVARQPTPALMAGLRQLDIALQGALNRLATALPAEPSPGLQRAADLSAYLLHKLRQRLHAIERMARLSAGELSPDDEEVLDQLCHSLTADISFPA